MRIGIDFDNTIICYDQLFCDLAKSWQLLDSHWQGNKQAVKEMMHALPEGDLIWQRLQGKAYGEFIQQATLFVGFKEFIAAARALSYVEIFIVSHKTELGHFDEKNISLRDAARDFLQCQGFFDEGPYYINQSNVFFETTREEKIERIRSLQCTHFIDDLTEVLDHPLFPQSVQRILFQSGAHLHASRAHATFS